MKQKFNVMFAVAATLSLASANVTYDWTGGSATFGDGAVSIVCESETGHVTSLAANPSADAITLTGVPMTFADGATVTIASTGTLSFVQKATALGALTLARGDDVYKVWTGSALTEPEGDSMPLVFPGLTTDDIDLVRIIATPGSIAGGGRYEYLSGPDVNKFYTFNHVSATAVYSLRVQLQNKTDGICARCRTGVRSPRFGLYPDEEDAWATTGLWEYFIRADRKSMPWGLYGYTSDPGTYGGVFVARISSLGVTKIIARRKGAGDGKSLVRFEGGAAFGGTTTIAAGMEAVLAVSEGDGAAELSNAINGDGDLTIVPQPATTAYAGSTYREDFISSTNWIVIATNRSLATLTSITGYMQGASHNGNTNAQGQAYAPSLCGTFFYRYDPASDTATVQFQFKRTATTTKYVQARLRQNGANVEISGVGYGYADPGTYGTEFPTKKVTTSDYTIKDWNPKVSELANPSLGFVPFNYTTGYGIRKVTATFGGAAARGYATVSGDLSGLSGGRLRVEGGNLPVWTTVVSGNGLPAGGEASVAGTNSEIRFRATSVNSDVGISGGSCRLVAEDGGVIRTLWGWQVRSTQEMELHGGTFVCGQEALYLQYLVLDGGIVSNICPRSAYNAKQQNWRICGTEPSHILSGVNLYGTSVNSYEDAIRDPSIFHIDVADVTGSEAADCIVASFRGAFYRKEDREKFAWCGLEKCGAGTLKLTGAGEEVRLAATIRNGTFLFGAGSAMTNDFVLAGGNLAAEAGSSNALGALTANTNATLSVEAGGRLSFASFAAGEGLRPKAVTIDAPLTGDCVRFGTDASGLAPEQLSFFRWKDGDRLRRVGIDEEGYLHPLPLGTMFSIW